MKDRVRNHIQEALDVKQKMLSDEKFIDNISMIADVITEAYCDKKKMLIAGNGGSAADAQHIAGELVSKFHIERPALPALALITNTSVLTATANDDSYDKVFSRQVEAFGNKGDVFFGISTSGNSENVIEAIKSAKNADMITVGLVGEHSCKMDEICDYIIKIPSLKTPIIQEAHITIGHILCEIVEAKMFG